MTSSVNRASRLGSALLAMALPRVTPMATLRNCSSSSRSLASGVAISSRIAAEVLLSRQMLTSIISASSSKMTAKPPANRVPMRQLFMLMTFLEGEMVYCANPAAPW